MKRLGIALLALATIAVADVGMEQVRGTGRIMTAGGFADFQVAVGRFSDGQSTYLKGHFVLETVVPNGRRNYQHVLKATNFTSLMVFGQMAMLQGPATLSVNNGNGWTDINGTLKVVVEDGALSQFPEPMPDHVKVDFFPNNGAPWHLEGDVVRGQVYVVGLGTINP